MSSSEFNCSSSVVPSLSEKYKFLIKAFTDVWIYIDVYKIHQVNLQNSLPETKPSD